MSFIVTYIAIAVVFFALDFCWLSIAADRLYRPEIGGLMLARPNLQVAGLFYALYVAGIAVLVVMPNAAGPWWATTLAGALLGLVAYGTYDLTNLSTLKSWPAPMSFVDMAWGMVLTAAAATAGYHAAVWLD